MPGRPLSAVLPTVDCKHSNGKHHEGHEFHTGGVPSCVIARHEVSLRKEAMLKCPHDEIGSSPGSKAGLQEEGDRSFSTAEDKSVDMMGCDMGAQ